MWKNPNIESCPLDWSLVLMKVLLPPHWDQSDWQQILLPKKSRHRIECGWLLCISVQDTACTGADRLHCSLVYLRKPAEFTVPYACRSHESWHWSNANTIGAISTEKARTTAGRWYKQMWKNPCETYASALSLALSPLWFTGANYAVFCMPCPQLANWTAMR